VVSSFVSQARLRDSAYHYEAAKARRSAYRCVLLLCGENAHGFLNCAIMVIVNLLYIMYYGSNQRIGRTNYPGSERNM